MTRLPILAAPNKQASCISLHLGAEFISIKKSVHLQFYKASYYPKRFKV